MNLALLALAFDPQLIGGQEISQAAFGHAVVQLATEGQHCTATVVGPRALITAAHCVTSSTGTFKVDQQTYTVSLTAHPKYEEKFDYVKDMSGIDYDIAFGAIQREVADVTPIPVGGVASIGEEVTLLGYGCTKPNGFGGGGKLRAGLNQIQTMRGTGIILAGLSPGASGCAGDSGGPGFVRNEKGDYFLLSVATQVDTDSNGNFKPETWEVTTSPEPIRRFLLDISTQKKAGICGLNLDCPTH